MKSEYGIELSTNYNDSGTMIYDLEKQEEVLAGGSGPACSPLVNYSYTIPHLQNGTLKRVLIFPKEIHKNSILAEFLAKYSNIIVIYEYIGKITGNKTVKKEIGKYKYDTNIINIGFTIILIKLKSGLILITNGKTSSWINKVNNKVLTK